MIFAKNPKLLNNTVYLPRQNQNDEKMIYIKGVIGQDVKLVDVVAAAKVDTEPILRVMIDSPGGYVEEGKQIYRFLKDYKKQRQVDTYTRGECASMAAQLFIVGQNRYIGSPYMIHNPSMLFMENGSLESGELRDHAEYLDDLKKEAIKEYKEVTGLDEQTLSDFMDNETWLTPDQCVELGFATAKQEFKAVALYGNPENKQDVKLKSEKAMSKINKIKEAATSLLAAFFGDEAVPTSMDLTDVNGTTFTVTREEGEPEVGDAASPDGSYTMPDGKTIVVTDGVITEIVEPTPDESEEMRKQLAEKDAEIARLTEELGKSKSQATQVATTLKEVLTAAEEDSKELEVLRAKAKATGNYIPAGRTGGKQGKDEVSEVMQYAAEQKAKREARKNK